MKLSAGQLIETSHGDGAGSTGCFAKDKNDRPVLLSCSHVLFPGFELISNLKVFHPSYSTCCSNGEPVATPIFDRKLKASKVDETSVSVDYSGGVHDGKWYGGFNAVPGQIRIGGTPRPGHPSLFDCAIATVDQGVQFENVWRFEKDDGSMESIPLVGPTTDGLGVVKGPPLGQAPSEEHYVRVYSQNSGRLKYATLLSRPTGEPKFPYLDPDDVLYPWGISDPGTDKRQGTRPLKLQFMLLPRPTPKPGLSYKESYATRERLSFDGGDSGSVIINHKNEIVGMLNRHISPEKLKLDTDTREFEDVKYIGLASPIEKVLEHLEITIPTSPQGWSGTGTTPARGRPPITLGTPSERETRRRALAVLRVQLEKSRRGRLLLGKIGEHHLELRRLLARYRDVNAAWTRLQGPAYYGHCVASLTDPRHCIPRGINGVSRQALAEGLLASMKPHASDDLVKDLERWWRQLIPRLLRIERMRDVPERLAEISPEARRDERNAEDRTP